MGNKTSKKKAAKPALLAGGNPQIAKADGDAPVQAYIAAMPGWKRNVGRRLDALIVLTVPGVRKAVKWRIQAKGSSLPRHPRGRPARRTSTRWLGEAGQPIARLGRCLIGPRVIAQCAGLTILALALLACGEGSAATAPSVASRTRAPAPTTGPTDPEVASFVKLMNAHRKSLGLPALVWDRRVAAVARAHSRDMFDRHYFSHESRDGRSSWDRLAERGVTYSRAGENIAWGQGTGGAVLRSWLGSRGHRKNIERESFTHHGVGKVGTYWTHVFIRPVRTQKLGAEKRFSESAVDP